MTSISVHKYPGLGHELCYLQQPSSIWKPVTYPTAAHQLVEGSNSVLLPIREVAMMEIMEKLTDKPDWHKKVFDEAIVAKWREEAMDIPDEVWLKMAAASNSGWDEEVLTKIRRQERAGAKATQVKGVMSEQVWDYVS